MGGADDLVVGLVDERLGINAHPLDLGDGPCAIVRHPDQDPADILWPALTVGYLTIPGELAGAIPAWAAPGGQLARTHMVDPSEVDSPMVVDVRPADEHATGHLPGAQPIELDPLTQHVDGLPGGPATVMCGHGTRAASLLDRAGHHDLSILAGGPAGWATATGHARDDVR